MLRNDFSERINRVIWGFAVRVHLLMVMQDIYGYMYLLNLAYPTYTSTVLMWYEIWGSQSSLVEIRVFTNVTQWWLVNNNRRLEKSQCFHIQGQMVRETLMKIAQSSKCRYLPVDTEQCPTRYEIFSILMFHSFIHSLVFSLRGRVGGNQSPVLWPVWLWHTASWASSWG